MHKFLITLLLIISGLDASGQSKPDSVSTNHFRLIKSNRAVTIIDSVQIDSLIGNVILLRDSVYLFADFVVIKNKKQVTAVGNVSIYESDSLKVFCDTLLFSGDDTQAFLNGNVVLQKNEEILKTDKMIYQLDTKDAIFNQGATLRKMQTLIRSMQGYYSSVKNIARFFNDVQLIDSSFNVQTDTLYYDRLTKKAQFIGPTLILQDSSKIFTNKGHYNLKSKSALFEGDPQYIGDDGTAATAKRILFDEVRKEMILEGNATVKKENQMGKAVKILINQETREMILTGDANFKEEKKEIDAPVIIYNPKTKNIETKGGVVINNDGIKISSDEMNTDPESGKQIASGNVVWIDTTNHMSMYCDTLLFSDVDESVDAFGLTDELPLLVQFSDEDTLYMVAKRFSFWEEVHSDSNSVDTLNFLSGKSKVSISSNSFQSISDSLVFNDLDSAFTLFGSPILWSDSLQLSGDTILISMLNSKVDQLKVPSNPFVVLETDSTLQDQMKGNMLNGIFINGKLDSLNISGNAEAIYFLKDDMEAFIGMNQNQSGEINLLFDVAGTLHEIRFVNNPTNKIIPMSKLDLGNARLDGYIWYPEKKPKIDYFIQLFLLKNGL